MSNPRVFMDFAIEGEQVGRVIFELFADVVPKTAENFRALCTGSSGVTGSQIALNYRGSVLHRIIAGFMIQGGDFTLRNGKGGESIYGGVFDDEDLRRTIDEPGLLVMANKGKNTNGSQFFVSLRPCPHLDGKHVVFGRVVKGYDVVEGLSKLAVTPKDVPIQLVTISNCGELERRKAPVKAPRSPSPVTSVVSSRSRSRSATPEDDRKSKRTKSSSRRERDENGKRIHKKSRRSSHRNEEDDVKRSSKKLRRSKDRKEIESEPIVSEEALKVIADEEARLVLEKENDDRIAEEKRIERAKELEAMKKRYETDGASSNEVQYKGRGAMKAPRQDGQGGMRGWN